MIKSTSQKGKKDKKKDKKKGGADVSFADGAGPGEGSDGEDAAAKGDISAPKKAVQMTAEELADEEWGPVKEKGKKAKKGKKKGKTQDDDEEEEEKVDAPPARAEAAQSPAPESKADEGEDGGEDGGPKVLSKKEKEKLKKEREKVSAHGQSSVRALSDSYPRTLRPRRKLRPQRRRLRVARGRLLQNLRHRLRRLLLMARMKTTVKEAELKGTPRRRRKRRRRRKTRSLPPLLPPRARRRVVLQVSARSRR